MIKIRGGINPSSYRISSKFFYILYMYRYIEGSEDFMSNELIKGEYLAFLILSFEAIFKIIKIIFKQKEWELQKIELLNFQLMNLERTLYENILELGRTTSPANKKHERTIIILFGKFQEYLIQMDYLQHGMVHLFINIIIDPFNIVSCIRIFKYNKLIIKNHKRSLIEYRNKFEAIVK